MRAGKYEVEERIAAGAFGTTFRARHVESGEVAVLKRLSLVGLDDWKPFERFEREAKVLRSLSHPGVVSFVDCFESEEGDHEGHYFYIVSELVEGPTLGERIAAGHRWEEDDARQLLKALLETLQYLHGLSPRVIHRDIKPGNVVLRDGKDPVVVDFGSVLDVSTRRPDGGLTVAGTAGYMPPEQAMGNVDPRSDLFAVGATMFHALTHIHPADAPRRGLRVDVRKHIGASEAFVSVLERMLEPNPDDRFDSATDALMALEEKVSAQQPAATTALVPSESSSPSITALEKALPSTPRPLTPAIRTLFTPQRYQGAQIPPSYAFAVGATIAMMIASSMVGSGVMTLVFVAALVACFVSMPSLVSHRLAVSLYKRGVLVLGRVTSTQRITHAISPTIEVRYATEFNGETIEGVFQTRSTDEHEVQEGDRVHVFFDPARPKNHAAALPFEIQSALER